MYKRSNHPFGFSFCITLPLIAKDKNNFLLYGRLPIIYRHQTDTMSETILEILSALPGNPSLMDNLYEELYKSIFITFARNGTEAKWTSIEFLTYNCDDGMREVPLFTDKSFVFKEYPTDALLVEAGGPQFWVKLSTMAETNKCVIAINPDQSNCTRITKEMILEMINLFGNNSLSGGGI